MLIVEKIFHSHPVESIYNDVELFHTPLFHPTPPAFETEKNEATRALSIIYQRNSEIFTNKIEDPSAFKPRKMRKKPRRDRPHGMISGQKQPFSSQKAAFCACKTYVLPAQNI